MMPLRLSRRRLRTQASDHCLCRAGVPSVPVVFLWTHDLTFVLIAVGVQRRIRVRPVHLMACWLPELFRRGCGHGGRPSCSTRRGLIAWTGPLISGWLIANFGGFSTAAVVIGCVYILSIAAAPFLPETRGKPLPE